MRKDIKEIRQVLKDYSRIKHDLKQVSFLPSPRFDAVNSHSNSNHTESKFIYHADLSWQLHRVEDAIDNIKDSKYRFIINKYIINKKYTRSQMCQRYDISLLSFNSMKNRALVEFAKNYGLNSVLNEINKSYFFEYLYN